MTHEIFWYKEAIIYEVHIKGFFDSASSGIGDFKGLTEKLDYLHDLGITAIWLLPFYPSPLKDDGYDISDYYNVNKQYGSLQDFEFFLHEAHRRGIKVITELVINHTSDQHPWFQEAKNGGEKRNYYVWSQDPEKYREARIIFKDFESSNWTWDPVSRSYYWHRFYSHQPDLNFDNPKVHEEIFKILHFWLSLGVDGVRLDAIPYLYEREGSNCENLPETHIFLKKLRKYVDEHFQDKLLLAEANQWPDDAFLYFGNGDECHMAFHFPVMPRLFMAIQLEDCLPIIEIMQQTPVIPENCQWAAFLRNHDELTLEMVTDEERDYMFRVYAMDPQARINLGIRRRLASLLKNDRRQMELMNSLLFCLVGTPVLYYGDEIGMGDNIYLGDRDGVRTPMQWSSDRNAGFSKANPQKLYLPLIVDPEYHYETVNIEAQQNNPHSFLWWTKQLISLRKRFRALSYGSTRLLMPDNRKVLVILREDQKERLMIIVNLSRFAQYAELDLKEYEGCYLVELFSQKRFPNIGNLPYFITLGPYGYFWFLIQEELEKEIFTDVDREKEKEIITLAFAREGNEIFSLDHRSLLNGLIRKYLERRLWFKKKLSDIDKTKTKIIDHITIEGKTVVHLVLVETLLFSADMQRYPLFITYLTGETAKKVEEKNPERVVAKLWLDSNNEGIVYEMGEEKETGTLLFDLMKNNLSFRGERGDLCGVAFETAAFHFPEQRSSEITRDGSLIRFPSPTKVIKLFNCVSEGLHLDTEIRHLLSKRSSFREYVPLTGYIYYRFKTGDAVVLAQEEIAYSDEHLAKKVVLEGAERFFLRMDVTQADFSQKLFASWLSLAMGEINASIPNAIGGDLEFARHIGKTTAALHVALATDEVEKELSFTLARSLYQGIRRKVVEAFSLLKSQHLQSYIYPALREVIPLEEKMLDFLKKVLDIESTGKRLRYHGQYSLENLIYIGKDLLVTNFSGKQGLSYRERRFKRSYFCDLSQMIFSFFETSYEALESAKTRGVLPHDLSIQKWQNWSFWISSSFLRSYLHSIENSSLALENKENFDFLMSLFLIERCAEAIIERDQEKREDFFVPVILLRMIFQNEKK